MNSKMLSMSRTAPLRSRVRFGLSRQRSVRVAASNAAKSAGATEKVKLGDSDLLVTKCCLGTMTWGKQNTEAEAHQQLSYALDAGINFIDTAESYPVPPAADTKGFTHNYISTWLKNQKRQDIVLATKVAGYSDRTTWLRDPPRTTRVNREQLMESVEGSLRRLKTDYVDLLQIHWPDRYVPLFGGGPYDAALERESNVSFEEQLRALEELIKAGKVRYVGVSNETSYGVSEFCHLAKQAGLPKIVSIQNCYSLLVRTPYETDLAETCRRHNVGLLAYSPLAAGALTGKYMKPESVPRTSRFFTFPGYMARYQGSLAKDAVAEYCLIAEKYGLTPAQLALAWCNSRWFVASSIIGATSVQQLEENIQAFNTVLPPECLQDILAVYKRYRDPAFN